MIHVLPQFLIIVLGASLHTQKYNHFNDGAWPDPKTLKSKTSWSGEEVDQIFRFVSRDGKRCLNFMHIPKVGGTSIAENGRGNSQQPIKWGQYDDELTCRDPFPVNPQRTCCRLDDGEACSMWHTPPRYDSVIAAAYERCKTFCFVRHPVDRALSEFQYQAKMMNNFPCDLEHFDKWLRTKIAAIESTSPYIDDCHMVSQYEYIFGSDRQKQYCQHILHYSNMTEEFNGLMKQYDIHMTMNKHENDSPCDFTITTELHDMIVAHYKDDVEHFNFTLKMSDIINDTM